MVKRTVKLSKYLLELLLCGRRQVMLGDGGDEPVCPLAKRHGWADGEEKQC